MTPEIKDFKTWEEAQRWLAKHGWGLGLIEQQKTLWDEANPTPKVEAKKVTTEIKTDSDTKPATKPVAKPVAKATE